MIGIKVRLPHRVASTFVLVLLALCAVSCKPKREVAGPARNGTASSDVSVEAAVPFDQPTAPERDLSLSNSVSIVFGEQDEENGLQHRSREKDGLTRRVRVGDEPCRYLNFKDTTRTEAYFYFAIDPGFKAGGLKNARIDVEYFDIVFDNKPSSISIHFDATGVRQGSRPAYTSASGNVVLRGTEQWTNATFNVRNASFQNSQNGQSDFRICVRPPELYVRKVTVTRQP
jgi:hypothetical protein